MGSVGEPLLGGSMGEQAGDESVSELSEGLVDERLQSSEGSGIASELVGPEGLLGREVGVDLLKRLIRCRDIGATPGVESDAHGKSSGGQVAPPRIA